MSKQYVFFVILRSRSEAWWVSGWVKGRFRSGGSGILAVWDNGGEGGVIKNMFGFVKTSNDFLKGGYILLRK